jgi:Zinc knuckle
LDTQKLRELCDRRDDIDAEIAATVAGTTKKDRKSLTCSKCGSPDHTARTCPQKELTV